MYDKIGEKIKKLAEVLGWICIIAGVIAAIGLWLGDLGGAGFLLGLAALAAGALGYVGTWVLYGFGQLVEDTAAMRRRGDSAAPQAPSAGTPTFEDEDLPEL